MTAAARDLTPLTGLWHKTNEEPQWIDHIVIRIDDVPATSAMSSTTGAAS